MLYDRLVRSTIGLEVLGVGALFIPIPFIQKLPICLFLRLIAVYSVYHWIRKNVPDEAQQMHRVRIILLTTLSYLLPPIGPVMLLLYADNLTRIELREELSHIKTVETPYYE